MDPTPVIRRPFGEADRDAEVLSEPHNDVSFTRGIGDSGRRVQIVAMDCPAEYCSHDRLIRLWRVSPVDRDTVEYWCLSPNCVHFVSDHLSWACRGSYPYRKTSEPAVWEPADA